VEKTQRMLNPDAPLPLSCEIELTPAFHDIDPLEIVWHGHYVKYLECARSALMDQFAYNYRQMRDSGYAWPIIELHLKYLRPVKLGQRIKIRAQITEWQSRLKIDYLISDALSGQKINQASSIQVAVEIASGEMQFLCPPILWQSLGVHAE